MAAVVWYANGVLMSTIQTGSRVGGNWPCCVIAEIGVNPDGEFA